MQITTKHQQLQPIQPILQLVKQVVSTNTSQRLVFTTNLAYFFGQIQKRAKNLVKQVVSTNASQRLVFTTNLAYFLAKSKKSQIIGKTKFNFTCVTLFLEQTDPSGQVKLSILHLSSTFVFLTIWLGQLCEFVPLCLPPQKDCYKVSPSYFTTIQTFLRLFSIFQDILTKYCPSFSNLTKPNLKFRRKD